MSDDSAIYTNDLFRNVPAEAVDVIVAGLPRISLSAGDMLFREGEPGEAVYLVVSGMIEIFTRRGTDDVTIRTVMPGSYFGELALLGQEIRSASARAVEPTVLLEMDRQALMHVISHHMAVAVNIGRVLAGQLVATTRSAVHVERGELVLLVVGRSQQRPSAIRYLVDAVAALGEGHTVAVGPRSLFPGTPHFVTAIRDNLRPAPGAATDVPHYFGYRGGSLFEAAGRADVVRIMIDYLRRWWRRAIIVIGEDERAWYELALPSVDRVFTLGTVDEILAWPGPSSRTAPPTIEAVPVLSGTISRRDVALALHRAGFRTPLIWLPDLATLTPVTAPGFERRHLTDLALPHQHDLLRLARALARKRVGLALGAGGARGMAHIGAARYLEERGVPIDCIVGTSIGAMVGGAFANGFSTGDCEAYLYQWMQTGYRKLMRPAFSFRAILSPGVIQDTCNDLFGDLRFVDLQTPLGVVAADLVTGRCVTLRGGSVARAVHASMSIPGMFPPVVMDPLVLVDGGVCDPVPTGSLSAFGADVKIVVNISYSPEDLEQWAREEEVEVPQRSIRGDQLPNVIDTYFAAFGMAVSERAASSAAQADVYIRPRFLVTSWREFSQGPEHLRRGYEAAERAGDSLRSALPWVR